MAVGEGCGILDKENSIARTAGSQAGLENGKVSSASPGGWVLC